MSENTNGGQRGGLGRRGILLGTTAAAATTVLAAASADAQNTPRPLSR